MTTILYVLATLLLTTSSPGLEIQQVYTSAHGLPSDEVRVVFRDGQGTMWAGTRAGFARYDFNAWSTDTLNTNPVSHGVACIYQDTREDMWFGGPGFAHRFDGDAYVSYAIRDDLDLAGRVVFAFHEDHRGNLWVGTTGGIAIRDGHQWAVMSTEQGLKDPVVHDIALGPEGRMWCATRRGGLNIYDGSDWEYRYPDKNCRKIFRDRADRMWVGTSSGLIMHANKTWQIWQEDETILPMFEGDKGYVWCVANGVDILRIAPTGHIIRHEKPCGASANEIYHLAYDSEGSVWAATDNGLFVLH